MEQDLTPAARLATMQTRAASLDMDGLLFNLEDIAITLRGRNCPGFDFRDPYNARLSVEAGVYAAELARRFERSTT